MNQIPVPSTFLDGVLKYVEVSSLATKKACDEVSVHRAAQEKAAALRPDLLNHMVAKGVVPAAQKQAAEIMLGAHDTSLQMLKAATDKIAEQQEIILRLKGGAKTAGDLGEGVDEGASGVAAGGSYQKVGEYNSLTSPMVGEKTANAKESDKALLKLIGR